MYCSLYTQAGFRRFSPPTHCRKRLLRRSSSSRRNTTACSRQSNLPSRTQRIMEQIATSVEVGGAGGSYSYHALKRLDMLWSSMCGSSLDARDVRQVVSRISGSAPVLNIKNNSLRMFDVVVCGGTLGIFVATALISKGLNVGIIERNQLMGREQEWNISREELLALVDAGVLLEDDIEEIIAVEFNPNRCGFEDKGDIWVKNILNLGISPAKLLELMKARFLSLGGVLLEGKNLSTIQIYDDLAVLHLADGTSLSACLVVDAMGNFSPVVQQIRSGRRPDGVCLVVGSCSRGFKENKTSDVIYSSGSVKKVEDASVKYFWEAFPAGSGSTDRTTYMFTYVEAQPGAPKLEDLLEEYWDLMPGYQGVPLDEIEILRVIFGIFPTYKDSPLQAAFDRIIQVGDASGIQSPVSFGGFGSMTRHLSRISNGIHEAVIGNFLDAYSLGLLNPYMPNLSASWMFQRAMSVRAHSDVPPTFINELLYANFQAMKSLGDSVLRPFLQDVIQFGPLVTTLASVMLNHPRMLPVIFKQVGVQVIFSWSTHFLMLGSYTFLSSYIDPVMRPWIRILPPRKKYELKRLLEAWKYGAGLDYNHSTK